MLYLNNKLINELNLKSTNNNKPKQDIYCEINNSPCIWPMTPSNSPTETCIFVIKACGHTT